MQPARRTARVQGSWTTTPTGRSGHTSDHRVPKVKSGSHSAKGSGERFLPLGEHIPPVPRAEVGCHVQPLRPDPKATPPHTARSTHDRERRTAAGRACFLHQEGKGKPETLNSLTEGHTGLFQLPSRQSWSSFSWDPTKLKHTQPGATWLPRANGF